MIDLVALAAVLAKGEDKVVVSRAWLAQVATELVAGRRCDERRGQVFGLPQGERL